MTLTKNFKAVLCAAVSLFAWALATSCTSQRSGHDDPVLCFVHGTDPHIYKEIIADLKDLTEKRKLQKLDEEALIALFEQIPSLPQPDGPPAFLLITGDFGIDPCLIPKTPIAEKDKTNPKVCLDGFDPKTREAQIENLAGLLAKSPIRDIYLVAGNNDLPLESATDEALTYFNRFIADVQTQIVEKKSNVQLFNLTGCYASTDKTASPCYKNVENTPYRVIGFPSQSFKNKDGDDASINKSKDIEVGQVDSFKKILNEAIHAEKKILIVTHIPDLDDPYLVGQNSYTDKLKQSVSAWNVKDEVLDGWKNAVASDSVVAVFAGHFHDANKETYRQPYSWSAQNDRRTALNKLFLAPPLSLKKQENSPIQARGFTTVTLFPHRTQSRFYWYDSSAKTFSPEPLPESVRIHHAPWLAHILAGFHWLWELDHSDGPLERAAVLLIALLAAFLTVIAVWQIPPSDNPLTKKPDDNKKPDERDTSKAAPEPSPFTTKFGKTVIAGLGGLIFTEIAKMIGNRKPSDDANYFYLVCFIVFFFSLLIFFSASRGLAEAIRSRVAVIHYPLARRPSPPRYGGNKKNGDVLIAHKENRGSLFVAWAVRWFWRIVDWLGYWILRIVNWVFSLKVPALTFFDTFINLVQGKNQTTTRALAEVVIDQQKNLIRVADAVRKNLMNLIESKMANQDRSSTLPHVRVNISVLSADQSSVFYVSRTPGSSLRPFTKRSVAWVSVFTGQIRWWCEDYEDNADKILLFDNSKGVIADAEDKILLSTYFQDRSGDYGGFVIIPLPWPQRSYGSKYVKGAIHISFRGNHDIYKIWKKDEIELSASGLPPGSLLRYSTPQRMLEDWCEPEDVRAVLQNAVVALGELLFGFNEIIYKNSLDPDQKD